MPPRAPAYNWTGFVAGCRSRQAFVRAKALGTASAYFGLATQQEVLDFIVSGGLDDGLTHASTKPLQKPPLTNPPDVDGYDFFSGLKFGYLAFFRAPTGIWTVKSFKQNEKQDPRNLVFYEAFMKQGLVKK